MDGAFTVANRKIDPARRRATALKADGSPDINDRIEIGPTDIAFNEWADLGLTPPNLDTMRRTRLDRIVAQLQAREYAGVLCFDPINIRYATDATNMQLWVAHDPSRAVFVSADGYVILWDFDRCDFLSNHLPLIDEVRTKGASFIYFTSGDQVSATARKFAGEIDDVLREHGGGNRRLAVDRMEIPGVRAFDELNIDILDGMQVMEHARMVKGVDEINAMKCALASCEIAAARMREAMVPGISEVELWSVLHKENIARGGEWIETRLMASGPRTNPWMHECGPRRIEDGDLVAFDTDMVGPYGMCSDISRTWYCGDGNPSDEQRRLHAVALEHIQANEELLQPGVSFTELTEKGHKLPEEYIEQRYCVMMHGLGLCDEFPAIYYPEDFVPGAFDYHLEAGMVLTVEAYIGAVGGREGVKLEDEILITEDGPVNITNCPFDEKLMA